MSSSHKRKGSPTAEVSEESSKRRFVESDSENPSNNTNTPKPNSTTLKTAEEPVVKSPGPSDSAADARRARFEALRARNATSKTANLRASQTEASRSTNESAALSSLARKHAVASQKLLKAETEAEGEDFERKRAWDWTVSESEKWDERLAEKESRKKDQRFQDYRQDARRTYDRQMRNFAPDLEAYKKEKIEQIERAVRSGELELVEMEDGEIVAVDRDGKFFGGGPSAGGIEQKKLAKEKIDNLVKDVEKADAAKVKKQKDRQKGQEESGDVTYINGDVSFFCHVFESLILT